MRTENTSEQMNYPNKFTICKTGNILKSLKDLKQNNEGLMNMYSFKENQKAIQNPFSFIKDK